MGRYSYSVHSATLRGVTVVPVLVEVVISSGIPSFSIVGMPDTAIQESKERIKAAIRSCGFKMPNEKIVVNLAPGAVRKRGSGFDLPIALGLLAATGQINSAFVDDALVVGELLLDGSARATDGLLAYQRCAQDQGRSLIVGAVASHEISRVEVKTYTMKRLGDIRHLPLPELTYHELDNTAQAPDFGDVKGHDAAKRALQVAAAGNHAALMVGPPGAGKTMLARCYPSILPPLENNERLDSALVYSVSGYDISSIMAGVRPFRSPHHSATLPGLLGGGNPVKPGEVSFAHNGVLFLDELAEFKNTTLQALRQPFEEGSVRLARADGTYEFPASFTLLAATNPCPCGYYGDPHHTCRCSEARIRAYQGKIGGPLLDRIDIRIDVWPLENSALLEEGSSVTSETLREGVLRAREFAAYRRKKEGNPQGLNQVIAACNFDSEDFYYFESLMDRRDTSARSLIKTLLLARTIADIEQTENVTKAHVSEAFMLRFKGGLLS